MLITPASYGKRPRLPSRRDAFEKSTAEFQIDAERDETEELHEEERAVGADAAGGEPRRKIGSAPAHGAGESQDYGERILQRRRGYRFFG